MRAKLGDTVRVRRPAAFRPSNGIFDGVVGWDKHGPVFAPPVEYDLVVLDTQEAVDRYNEDNP